MAHQARGTRGPRLRLWAQGAALGLLAWSAPARADDAPMPLTAIQPVPVAGAAAAPGSLVLSLPECIQMALGQQPELAAYRASLASAQLNSQALQDLRVPRFLARDLPIRRRQASLGVTIAAAGLDQAGYDTVYAVTRLYYSVIYARAQKQVVGKTLDRLKATHEAANRLVQGGSRDVTTGGVNKIAVYMRLAEIRRAEAERGEDRALAALKEAIGLDPAYCLQIPEDRLPDVAVTVCKGDIVSLALARRGEVAQAGTLAEVTALEVCAQGKSCRPTMRTFASVVDVHSRVLPATVSDGEYRPGALAPDMPTTLVGPRQDRVDRAGALSARASAVFAKTRGLIALEAEDAFIRWEEASKRVPAGREAADKAGKLAEDTQNDFAAGARVKVEDVLGDEVLEGQAKAQYNEALYLQAIALAGLERVTAGGFKAFPYPAAPASPQQPEGPEVLPEAQRDSQP